MRDVQYRYQRDSGRLFVHEHVWDDPTFQLRCIQEVLAWEDVDVTRSGQSMLTAIDRHAPKIGCMSNCEAIRDAMAECQDSRCQTGQPLKVVTAVLGTLRLELQHAVRAGMAIAQQSSTRYAAILSLPNVRTRPKAALLAWALYLQTALFEQLQEVVAYW